MEPSDSRKATSLTLNHPEAADLLRRFAAFTGISKIDDLLDEIRATQIIKGLLARLGIGE